MFGSAPKYDKLCSAVNVCVCFILNRLKYVTYNNNASRLGNGKYF